MVRGKAGTALAFWASTLALACAAGPAVAAEATFSIPPQSLSTALKAFGDQSGETILYRRDDTALARSPGVVGRFESAAALSRLLQGSSFEYVQVGQGFIVSRVQPGRPSTTPAFALAPSSLGRNAPIIETTPLREVTLSEVVVTGSLIRGVAPVGSAYFDISRDTINAIAPTNVKDLMATVPALGNFGTNAEQSTPNRFRNAGYQANIHNLGIYATLTLLNGHRVAPVGTAGTFADPSTIPTIAIRRVELIADGASAVYGSDAVAGVVNFIYRQPFDGAEASATYSFDERTRYQKRDLAFIGGRLWDAGGGGGVMAAYEYSSNRSPLTTQVPFLALGGNQTTRGGRDLRSTNCLQPTIRAALPNGAGGGTTYSSAADGFSTDPAALRCGILSPTAIIADGQRHAALVTANQQLTERVKLWGELNYGHVENQIPNGRVAISVIVPNTNPFFAANTPPALAGAASVSVSRSGLGLFNPARTVMSSTVATAVAGLDINLGHDWKGTASLLASATRDFFYAPELDTNNIIAAVNDPNPATALNLFAQAAGNNPATLARIDDASGQRNWGAQRLQDINFKADGPLVAIAGGEVRAAAGVSMRMEQLNQLQAGGSQAPTSGFYLISRDNHVRRTVSAAFGELNIPLVGPANALPAVEALTLSVSGRYDDYDSYGGRFNPKYGVEYSPLPGLSLRASYGTSFAAPGLGQLTSFFAQPSYNQSPNVVVGYGPYKGLLLQNINQYVVGGGDPTLKPEEARTNSFGVAFSPSRGALSGLRLSATRYHVRYFNLVQKITTPADLLTNEGFKDLAILFPTPEQTAYWISKAPPTSAITVSNFDYIPLTQSINIGTRIYEGLDLDASWRLPTRSFGAFTFAFNGNRQLRYDEEIVPRSGFKSRLGTADAVKWKTRSTFAWTGERARITLFYNYTGAYQNTSVTPFQSVKPFRTVDLSLAYTLGDPNRSYLKGVTLQARVVNLFDRSPPFFDSAAGYNPGLASPFPRSFDLTVRATF